MTLDTAFLDALEASHAREEQPLFYVEPVPEKPDDKAKWSEDYRQRAFVAWIRKRAPEVTCFSIANERRVALGQMRKLKATGLTPGVPDICVLWSDHWAFIEFKGFDARGRPGTLSPQQIATCNRIHSNNTPVACFYTASAALQWLRDMGAPVP